MVFLLLSGILEVWYPFLIISAARPFQVVLLFFSVGDVTKENHPGSKSLNFPSPRVGVLRIVEASGAVPWLCGPNIQVMLGEMVE